MGSDYEPIEIAIIAVRISPGGDPEFALGLHPVVRQEMTRDEQRIGELVSHELVRLLGRLFFRAMNRECGTRFDVEILVPSPLPFGEEKGRVRQPKQSD